MAFAREKEGVFARLQSVEDDESAMEIVAAEYERLIEKGSHSEVLIMYLLGRTFMDCSLIVNIVGEEKVAETNGLGFSWHGYSNDGELRFRATLVDLHLKPLSKIEAATRSFADLLEQPRVQFVRGFLCAGGTIEEALKKVEEDHVAKDAI